MRFARIALATIVILLAVTGAAAQSGGFSIRVADSNGPLPGATVTISHETGFVKTTSLLTNPDGVVDFPVLRPGRGYVIDVSFPGFASRRMADLKVEIGKVPAITVVLSEEIVERVKVTAQSDVVDLETTATSTKFNDEFIQDLPVAGRAYQQMLTLAPGVQDADGDGNPNVHGSRTRDFKAEVGGVSNVDPLTGQYMSEVNPDAIEEIEVVTAGAGVEFSRAQGGFARILQKQGSNEFEGVFGFIWQSSLLDGTGANDNSNLPDPEFQRYQPSIQVSGPIVKDKLWYRLSHEYINQEIPVNTLGGIEVTTVERGNHDDQITWQVSPRNKLAFNYRSDPLVIDNFGISSLIAPESAQRRENTGDTYSLEWTAPYSPKILVVSRVAWQDRNLGIFPSTTGVNNRCVLGEDFLESARCFNIDSSEVSGSYFQTWDDHRQRLTVRSDATVYGGRFWGMNHQFKFGTVIETERYFRDLERRPTINVFLYSSLGDPDSSSNDDPQEIAIVTSRFAIPQTDTVNASGMNWGIYGEDQIKPRQNLTITLGLRIDREEISAEGRQQLDPEAEFADLTNLIENENIAPFAAVPQVFTSYEAVGVFIKQLADTLGIPESDVAQNLASSTKQSAGWAKTRVTDNQYITNTNPAPFLGVSWDPWSNGKTKFAFTARRYYDKIFLTVPLIELEPATTDLAWQANPVTVPDVGRRYVVDDLRGSVNPAVNISSVDRNLSTPYNDEFTFQFERELWAETSFRLTYVNRKFRDQLQDIDLNHVPADFGACKIASSGDSTSIRASDGVGAEVVDPYTGEVFIDTNPGPGDGRIDDCSGEVFLAELSDEDPPPGTFPLNDGVRLERQDGVPDLYIQNPGWGDMFLVSNLNSVDYQAYVLEVIRRQYRSWEMQASYTWSEARGDGEDFNQALGDDRSLLLDEQGYQSYDQRHVVKLIAATITPWGFRLGGSVTWQSGLPFSLINQKQAYGARPPLLLNQGQTSAVVRQQYETGQRNDQRNQSYWDVNLKFTKEMNVGRGLNLQFSAEVFNLLNDGTYIIFNPATESGQQINGQNVATRRFGRQWQLGFKMAF